MLTGFHYVAWMLPHTVFIVKLFHFERVDKQIYYTFSNENHYVLKTIDFLDICKKANPLKCNILLRMTFYLAICCHFHTLN